MKKVPLLTLCIFGLLLLAPKAALACGCPTVTSLEQHTRWSLAAAKVVFTGTVTSMTGDSANRMTTTLKVHRSWKMALPEEVVLTGGGSSCDYHFERGGEYLIFAGEEDGRLHTGACSRNVKLDKAAMQLKILGKGLKPKRKSVKNNGRR